MLNLDQEINVKYGNKWILKTSYGWKILILPMNKISDIICDLFDNWKKNLSDSVIVRLVVIVVGFIHDRDGIVIGQSEQ